MSKYLVSDLAQTTLATGISAGSTSCTVAAGAGGLFPSPNPTTGTKFLATLQSVSNPTLIEVVTVTARSTDTMTMSPTVNAYVTGDYFAIRNAAEMLEILVQFDDLQAQAGNYAIDTGSANAYVVTLTPTVGTPVAGMPIRWLAAHTNTGASTLNGQPLVLTNGNALSAGDVVADGLYESVWNPALSAYQLDWVVVSSFEQLTGQIADGQVPETAVLQFLTEILASAMLTGTPTAPTAAPGTNTTQVATTAFADAAAMAAADAAANPGASLTENGYQAFLSGLILQWGSFTSNGGSVGISFPQTFPHACFGVQVTVSNGGGYTVGAQSVSTSGFSGATSFVGSSNTCYWFAVGY